VRKDFADDQDPCEQENYLLVTDGLRFIVVERRNGMFTAFAIALVAAPYLMMQGLRRSSVRQAHTPCTREALGQYLRKLTARADLPGATIRAPVPRAPALDLCPGRLATADAQ